MIREVTDYKTYFGATAKRREVTYFKYIKVRKYYKTLHRKEEAVVLLLFITSVTEIRPNKSN